MISVEVFVNRVYELVTAKLTKDKIKKILKKELESGKFHKDKTALGV